MSVLKGAKIVLGVTGSIAAYKAASLASFLVQAGAEVEVIMTEAATKLIAPLTFQTLTQRPVALDMFVLLKDMEMAHISLAQRAQVLAIAPATANTIAKLAYGIADNLLTATALSTRAPILIAPAMDSGMYENALTQENIARLKERGVSFVGPAYGRLASGAIGQGRLADQEDIVAAIRTLLGRQGDLAGRKIVVTAGGTREPLDPVRFIGNHSSGKMGYRLAEAARDRGAQVTLICGYTSDPSPRGIPVLRVSTTEEMKEAVERNIEGADVLTMAAAPADFRPVSTAESKIKKRQGRLTLALEHTPDILGELASRDVLKIGFAAETENLVENARRKLAEKGLDLIVANPVPETFGAEESMATIIDRAGRVEKLGLLPKAELAQRILDRAVELLKGRGPQSTSSR